MDIEQQLARIYDRMDEIQRENRDAAEKLSERIKGCEIWQAYQAGRLGMFGVLCTFTGVAIMGLLRHYKILGIVILAVAVAMLSGCAASRPPQQITVATTQAHVEREAAFVSEAATSTAAAKRGIERVSAANKEARQAVEGIADQPEKEQIKAKLREVEQGASEANAELARVSVALDSAKIEEANTKTALVETQMKITSMEAYNVTLTKDRDAAVERADCFKKDKETLAGRLSRIALVIAGCAAWLAWMFSRWLGLKALPPPYCYAWPGLASAAAGVATFSYLRYFL